MKGSGKRIGWHYFPKIENLLLSCAFSEFYDSFFSFQFHSREYIYIMLAILFRPQCAKKLILSASLTHHYDFVSNFWHLPGARVKNCWQNHNANLGKFIKWFSCASGLGWKPMFPSQQWPRLWLGAVRQQAITCTIVDQDPCRHMASLGVDELRHNIIHLMAKVISYVYIHI